MHALLLQTPAASKQLMHEPQSSPLCLHRSIAYHQEPSSAGENPATWMLEVSGGAAIAGRSKAPANTDFAAIYQVCP